MARRPAGDVAADDNALLALASGLGRTEAQARRSLRALEAAGHLVVEHRFLPNGGQAENAYRVTPAGRERLGPSKEPLA